MMSVKNVFCLFCDCWKLYAKYAATDLNDEDLQQFVDEAQDLYHNKYSADEFAKDLIKAVVNEISMIEISKHKLC